MEQDNNCVGEAFGDQYQAGPDVTMDRAKGDLANFTAFFPNNPMAEDWFKHNLPHAAVTGRVYVVSRVAENMVMDSIIGSGLRLVEYCKRA